MTAQKPLVTYSEYDESHIQHPAFGIVSVSRVSTNGHRLFASDLSHSEYIKISIHEAHTVETDGIQSHRQKRGDGGNSVAEIELSPAQWASLVASFGVGEGVPCTLRRVRDGKTKLLPEIDQFESTRERFERQIHETVEKQTGLLQEIVGELASLAAKGKANKTELNELCRRMAVVTNNMPSEFAYSTKLMQEVMEHIIASGKAELETVAVGVATRLGIKEIGRLANLENPRSTDSVKK